jgi:hypothetical protein
MEVGPTFRITVPKYPTQDPNYRVVANQRSRFTQMPDFRSRATRSIWPLQN